MSLLHRRARQYSTQSPQEDELIRRRDSRSFIGRVLPNEVWTDIESPRLGVREAHQHHAVQFYDDKTVLYATVADFLGQALVDEQPAILVATAPHRESILRYLSDRTLDVAHTNPSDDLIV